MHSTLETDLNETIKVGFLLFGLLSVHIPLLIDLLLVNFALLTAVIHLAMKKVISRK